MKRLQEHLNESLNEAKSSTIKNRTIGQLVSWYNGYGPEGRNPEEKAPDKEKYDCAGAFGNGGFDTFKSEKEMYDYIIKNKNVKVDIDVNATPYDFEISFVHGGKEVIFASAYEPFSEIYKY